MIQELAQEILADHEMCDALARQSCSDLGGIPRRLNGAEKKSGKLSSIVEIVSLAIIRSSSDKEKINFCRRRELAIDKLKS